MARHVSITAEASAVNRNISAIAESHRSSRELILEVP